MTCPNCGAGVTRAMLDTGACTYCRTALVRPAPPRREAPDREVVHITHVKVHAPTQRVHQDEPAAAEVPAARVLGCFSGCATSVVSVALLFAGLAVAVWQIWAYTPSAPLPPAPMPAPVPAPVVQPADPPAEPHPHPHPRRRR